MPHNLSLGDDLLPYSRVFTKAKATYACSVKKGESVNAVKMAIPEKDKTKKPTGQTTAVKNPARTRPTRAVSTTKPLKSCSPIKIAPPVSTKKVKSSAATSADKFSTDAGSSLQAAPRDAVLNREIAKAQKRANAREKEADALRTRVQELEPEVRRLERELEKRRTERCAPLLSPRSRTANQQQAGANSNSPQRMTGVREDDAALRGRVEAAEKRAKVLQLRCDQLELEKSLPLAQVAPPQQNIAISLTGDTVVTGMLSTEEKTKGKNEAKEDGGRGGQQEQAEAKRVKQQLEVAERRMKNSLYINEAHESLAALATAREREANARAAESERRLNRALEKLESIERRDTIAGLRASCVRDEEAIHMTERELRAHQLDPEFYLPVNTAKRRQLARSEQRLQRLRLRHASQSAALVQTELVERLHSDLRMAAGSGDVAATGKILEAAGGLSVNVPDETSLSAFLYACGQANPELVKVLLEAGGDVLDGDGRITGLIVAARKGEVNTVQALLEAGADVSARDSAGGTALHAAAVRGHVSASRVLLEAGSDCNAIDQGTNTPLHMLASTTAEGAGAELATLLLEWGASVGIKNSEALTAVSAAHEARNRELVLAYRAFFGEDTRLDLPSLSANGRVGAGNGVSTKNAVRPNFAVEPAVDATVALGGVLAPKRVGGSKKLESCAVVDSAEISGNGGAPVAGGFGQAQEKQEKHERKRQSSGEEGVIWQSVDPTKTGKVGATAISSEKMKGAMVTAGGTPEEERRVEQTDVARGAADVTDGKSEVVPHADRTPSTKNAPMESQAKSGIGYKSAGEE